MPVLLQWTGTNRTQESKRITLGLGCYESEDHKRKERKKWKIGRIILGLARWRRLTRERSLSQHANSLLKRIENIVFEYESERQMRVTAFLDLAARVLRR